MWLLFLLISFGLGMEFAGLPLVARSGSGLRRGSPLAFPISQILSISDIKENQMFKTIVRAMLFLFLLVVSANAGSDGHGHGDAGKAQGGGQHVEGSKVTLTGEVMDLACYMQHPKMGQGPDHAGCARQCIKKGLPAGFKVGNDLYLLIGGGHGPIAEKIAPFAGKKATVTGKVLGQDGMKTLVMEKIEAAGHD